MKKGKGKGKKWNGVAWTKDAEPGWLLFPGWAFAEKASCRCYLVARLPAFFRGLLDYESRGEILPAKLRQSSGVSLEAGFTILKMRLSHSTTTLV